MVFVNSKPVFGFQKATSEAFVAELIQKRSGGIKTGIHLRLNNSGQMQPVAILAAEDETQSGRNPGALETELCR